MRFYPDASANYIYNYIYKRGNYDIHVYNANKNVRMELFTICVFSLSYRYFSSFAGDRCKCDKMFAVQQLSWELCSIQIIRGFLIFHNYDTFLSHIQLFFHHIILVYLRGNLINKFN